MDNTQFDKINTAEYMYGIYSPNGRLETLLRVLKTMASFSPDDSERTSPTPHALYERMRNATIRMSGTFPGDQDAFFNLFLLFESLSESERIGYMASVMSSSGRMGVLTASDQVAPLYFGCICDKTKTVLVGEGERFVAPLYDSAIANPDVQFTSTSENETVSECMSLLFAGRKNVKCIKKSIYEYGFIDEKFDLLIALPNMGGRMLIENGDFLSREPSYIALQNLLYHLNSEGTLAIILPAKISFAGADSETLRRFVSTNYSIKEISSLPAGVFLPYTAIRTYFLRLSTGASEDIVLKQYDMKKTDSKSPASLFMADQKLLFSDELDELGGWNVDMAFASDDDDVMAFRDSSMRKKRIADVASVFRGKSVTDRSKNGPVDVINISDISEAGIATDGLSTISEPIEKIARYILRDGDVLITSRGTTIKTAVFKSGGRSKACIACSNINVVRPGKELIGGYLKLFFDTQVGMKLLRSLQRGVTIVNINFKDILDIEVPVPSLGHQQKLVSQYDQGLDLYMKTINAAKDAWDNIKGGIEDDIFKGE